MNESRYGKRRQQARCRYRAVRRAEKHGESSVWKQNRKLEVTSDSLQCLTLRSAYEDWDTDDKTLFKRGNSGKEHPNYVWDVCRISA